MGFGGEYVEIDIEKIKKLYRDQGYSEEEINKLADKDIWGLTKRNTQTVEDLTKTAEELSKTGMRGKVSTNINGISIETEISGSKVVDKAIDYGKGNTTIEELANNIYGSNTTPEIKENMARYLLGDKVVDGADYGQYKYNLIDSDVNTGRKIGNFIGDTLYNSSNVEIPDKVINDINNNINNNFKGNTVGQIQNGMNFQIEHNNYIDSFDKEMKDLNANFMKSNEVFDLTKNKELKTILDKMGNGEQLTTDEIKIAKQYQTQLLEFDKAKNEMLDRLGIETVNGDNGYEDLVFKQKDINIKKTSKSGKEYTSRISRNILDKELSSKVSMSLRGNESYISAKKSSALLDYEINDDGYTKINKTKSIDDELNEALNNKTYNDAVSKMEGKDANTILKDTKAFYGSSDAENLYKLKQAGVDIGPDGERILNSYATAYNSKIDAGDNVISGLNKASVRKMSNYNINPNNIEYINNQDGLRLNYDSQNGRYSIDVDSINKIDPEILKDKKFENLVNSTDVGREDLSKLSKTVNRRFQEVNAIKDTSYKTYDKFINAMSEKYNAMSDATSEYGLTKAAQLEAMGLSKEQVQEIIEAKDFKSISGNTAKAFYNAQSKSLSQQAIELGNLDQEQIQKIIANNKEMFSSSKHNSLTTDEFRKIFGQNIGLNEGKKLASGIDFHVKGLDISDYKQAKKFYDSLIGDDGKINFNKLDDVFEVKNRDSVGSVQDLIKAALSGNLNEYKKNVKRDKLMDTITKTLEGIEAYHGETMLSANDKKQISALKKQLKDRDFDKTTLDKISDIADKAKDYEQKFTKLGDSSNGFKDSAKGIFNKLPGKKALAIAAPIVAIGTVAYAASKASEERERKRQEMNQLIAAQSASIRGGY